MNKYFNNERKRCSVNGKYIIVTVPTVVVIMSIMLVSLGISSCNGKNAAVADSIANDSTEQVDKAAAVIEAVINGTAKDVPSQADGEINGHAYVDLGLSVKWATCNLGANSPEAQGKHYAWGETQNKQMFTEANSSTYNKELKSAISGNAQYDAATAAWGDKWQLPTKEQIRELIKNTSRVWTSIKGKNGYLMVSKKNGKSIFLPAAGYRSLDAIGGENTHGYYWGGDPSERKAENALTLGLSESHFQAGWNKRSEGQSIRPVAQ